MRPSKFIRLSAVAGALAACATAPTEPASAPTAASAPAQTAPAVDAAAVAAEQETRLNALLEEFFEQDLKLNPIRATIIQDPRYHYLLPNLLSPSLLLALETFDRYWLERVEMEVQRDALRGQARLSYDIFVSQRKTKIEGYGFAAHLQPITQFFGIPSAVAMFGSGQSAQPFRTVKDYDDWLLRLGSVVVLFDQAIVNMREGIQKKVVQPRVVVERAIPQIAAHVVKKPEKSIFWRPIANMPKSFSAADKRRLTAAYRQTIRYAVVPAYRRLHDFMKDEYLAGARASHGYWDLPNGEAWYAHEIRKMTTTERSPDALHELGLREVSRIQGEMRKVMSEIGFQGDLKAFFAHVRDDPRFYFDNEKDVLKGYRELQGRVNALVPKLFDIFPKADYEVRAVEKYRAKSSAAASYMRGSPDGSRPGVFYVNTHDLKRQPKFGMETLVLHEATPGHHFQISIQQEVETLPKFRRFGGFSAFAEGWALYAESIGKELGMFTDPLQYYGKLDAELLRAMRLVVDTGLHAKKWPREQAIAYMKDNSSLDDTDVIAEVERYIALPGQALTYKVGQLCILDIRKKAEAALGAAFDIKAFHRAILVDGSLPLDVLERKMDEWIEAEKTKKRA